MLFALVLVGAGWLVFDESLAMEYFDFEDDEYEDEDDIMSTSNPGSELARVRRFPDTTRTQGPQHLDQIKDALNQIMPGRDFENDYDDSSPMNEITNSLSTEELEYYDSTTNNNHFLTPIPMRNSNTTDEYLDQGFETQGKQNGPHRTSMRPSRSTVDRDSEKEELIAYINSMTGQLLTVGSTGSKPMLKMLYPTKTGKGVLKQGPDDTTPDVTPTTSITTTATSTTGTTAAAAATTTAQTTNTTGSGTALNTTGTSTTKLPLCVTTTEAVTTTETTPKKTTRQFDIEKFLEIVANLTYDYYTNLTEQVNETLIKMHVPTCGTPSTTTELTTTTEPRAIDYADMTEYLMGKCFVCGLEDTGIPYNAHCADAFAGDFIPLVPQDPRAKGHIARFRKYCRYMDVNNFELNSTMPRSIFGRWTGGCSVRWTDLSGVYTQRACRNRRQPATGRHFASKRMAKLEQTLSNTDNGCIISPVATLLPLSRGISLYARFHACVCTGNWCNTAIQLDSDVWMTAVTATVMVWLNNKCCVVW